MAEILSQNEIDSLITGMDGASSGDGQEEGQITAEDELSETENKYLDLNIYLTINLSKKQECSIVPRQIVIY